MNPVNDALAALLASLERAGGYAALVGIVLVGTYWLARYAIAEQRKASFEREREAERRSAEMLRRADEALMRERGNAEEHQRRTDRVIDVVESNTHALTLLVSGQRRQEEILSRVDEHLASTRPKLPKTRTGRAAGQAMGAEGSDDDK